MTGIICFGHNPLLAFLSVCGLDLALLLRDIAGQEAIATHPLTSPSFPLSGIWHRWLRASGCGYSRREKKGEDPRELGRQGPLHPMLYDLSLTWEDADGWWFGLWLFSQTLLVMDLFKMYV